MTAEKRTWLWRWWPSIATTIAGVVFSTTMAALVGMQFNDYDSVIAMATFIGLLGGIATGLGAVIIWFRRNPW